MSEWPKAKTANGVTIVPGLKVRDYNWNETVVTDHAPSIDGGTWSDEIGGIVPGTGTPWFRTENGGLFDGSRMQAI